MKLDTWIRLSAAALILAGGAASAAESKLDRKPVSAAEFWAYRRAGKSPSDTPNPPSAKDPAVNLTWHQANGFCASKHKRLPSVQEWIAACQARTIRFPWWIWEWTSTDAGKRGAGFKTLCGPGPVTCECTHSYHTTWANQVKGFRCARSRPSVRLGLPPTRPSRSDRRGLP